MASEMTYTIERKGEWDIVRLDGHISEASEFHFNEILSHIGSKCVLNLRGAVSINSSGIRSWINFIESASNSREVVLEELMPAMTAHLNVIPIFAGKAKVKSVYGHFVCGECKNKQLKLFEKGRNLPTPPNFTVETTKCSKCGNKMEMEDFEEEYFSWVEAI